ncbi:MAG: amidase domain-containing protein [Chitinophagaceae bacterium]
MKDTAATWTSYMEDKNRDILLTRIQAYKTNLASHQLIYTAFTSAVVIDSAIFNGDSATVFSTDRYTLTSSDRDPRDTTKFIVTNGIYKYRVRFIKAEKSWLIRNFYCKDISRFSFNASPKIVVEQQLPDTTQALMYTYDPENARAYAERHWENGNAAYCDFSNPNGDCTNFLSQCLFKGGWPQDAVWKSKLRRDCPTCRNSTCVAMECYGCRWAVAQDFKYYITHEGRMRVESMAQKGGNLNNVEVRCDAVNVYFREGRISSRSEVATDSSYDATFNCFNREAQKVEISFLYKYKDKQPFLSSVGLTIINDSLVPKPKHFVVGNFSSAPKQMIR